MIMTTIRPYLASFINYLILLAFKKEVDIGCMLDGVDENYWNIEELQYKQVNNHIEVANWVQRLDKRILSLEKKMPDNFHWCVLTEGDEFIVYEDAESYEDAVQLHYDNFPYPSVYDDISEVKLVEFYDGENNA